MNLIDRLKTSPDAATIADAIRALTAAHQALSVLDAMVCDYSSDDPDIQDRAARYLTTDVASGGTAKWALEVMGVEALPMRSDCEHYEVEVQS